MTVLFRQSVINFMYSLVERFAKVPSNTLQDFDMGVYMVLYVVTKHAINGYHHFRELISEGLRFVWWIYIWIEPQYIWIRYVQFFWDNEGQEEYGPHCLIIQDTLMMHLMVKELFYSCHIKCPRNSKCSLSSSGQVLTLKQAYVEKLIQCPIIVPSGGTCRKVEMNLR